MSHRPAAEDDTRPSKRVKYDEEDHDPVDASVSMFSQLYCGFVCLVQSYLSMSELLQLSKVSHHFRDVALGNLNPSGLYRMGKDVSYISYDLIRHLKERKAESQSPSTSSESHVASAAAETENESSSRDLTRRQSINLVSLGQPDPSILNRMQESLPRLSTRELLAMIPAPSYGAPPSARHLTCRNLETDLMCFSPVPTRHALQLSIDSDFRELGFITLLLRLPYLQSLTINAWVSRDDAMANFPFQLLQFPPTLRSLTLSRGTETNGLRSRAFEKIIPLLPSQCPQLEELTIQSDPHESADLSPLLRLPNLTRLTITVGQFGISDHSANVFRQLRRLKYLRLDQCKHAADVAACLPDPPNALEEFHMPMGCGEEEFAALATRAPQVKLLSASDCPLVNHSVLARFRALQTLEYDQSVEQRVDEENLAEDENVEYEPSDVAQQCIATHGSLDDHASHVISIINRFNSLTDLKLRDLHSPPMTRGAVVNAAYFASRGMKHDHTLFYWPQLAADFPVPSFTSPIPYAPCPTDSPNSVYRLAALLPHLTNVTLAHGSALQLPGLSFVAHLPQLRTLSVEEAYFMPVESLYDLHHVSSTLTSLTMRRCFSVDSKRRYVYLLHDVLKPFQFSSPVTQAATFNFAAHLRKPTHVDGDGDTGMTSSSDSTSSTPAGATIVLANDAWCSSGVAESSNLPILSRTGGYHEIRRLPPPKIHTTLATMLQLVRIHEHARGEEVSQQPVILPEMEWRGSPLYGRLMDPNSREPYRTVFDSFTVQAPPVDEDAAKKLRSCFLPHLEYCEIENEEPYMRFCSFVYNRRNMPRYHIEALGADPPEVPPIVLKQQNNEERQVIQAMYNVELNYCDIKGMEYWKLFEPSGFGTRGYHDSTTRKD